MPTIPKTATYKRKKPGSRTDVEPKTRDQDLQSRRTSLQSRCSLRSNPSRLRFKTLNDINSNHFMLFHSGSRWLSFLLDFIAAIMTLFVALFVVLSDNSAISPSLKGLALSYTIQVRPSMSECAPAKSRPVAAS